MIKISISCYRSFLIFFFSVVTVSHASIPDISLPKDWEKTATIQRNIQFLNAMKSRLVASRNKFSLTDEELSTVEGAYVYRYFPGDSNEDDIDGLDYPECFYMMSFLANALIDFWKRRDACTYDKNGSDEGDNSFIQFSRISCVSVMGWITQNLKNPWSGRDRIYPLKTMTFFALVYSWSFDDCPEWLRENSIRYRSLLGYGFLASLNQYACRHLAGRDEHEVAVCDNVINVMMRTRMIGELRETVSDLQGVEEARERGIAFCLFCELFKVDNLSDNSLAYSFAFQQLCFESLTHAPLFLMREEKPGQSVLDLRWHPNIYKMDETDYESDKGWPMATNWIQKIPHWVKDWGVKTVLGFSRYGGEIISEDVRSALGNGYSKDSFSYAFGSMPAFLFKQFTGIEYNEELCLFLDSLWGEFSRPYLAQLNEWLEEASIDLERVTQCLAPLSRGNRRELWDTIPKDLIDAFGDNEDFYSYLSYLVSLCDLHSGLGPIVSWLLENLTKEFVETLGFAELEVPAKKTTIYFDQDDEGEESDVDEEDEPEAVDESEKVGGVVTKPAMVALADFYLSFDDEKVAAAIFALLRENLDVTIEAKEGDSKPKLIALADAKDVWCAANCLARLGSLEKAKALIEAVRGIQEENQYIWMQLDLLPAVVHSSTYLETLGYIDHDYLKAMPSPTQRDDCVKGFARFREIYGPMDGFSVELVGYLLSQHIPLSDVITSIVGRMQSGSEAGLSQNSILFLTCVEQLLPQNTLSGEMFASGEIIDDKGQRVRLSFLNDLVDPSMTLLGFVKALSDVEDGVFRSAIFRNLLTHVSRLGSSEQQLKYISHVTATMNAFRRVLNKGMTEDVFFKISGDLYTKTTSRRQMARSSMASLLAVLNMDNYAALSDEAISNLVMISLQCSGDDVEKIVSELTCIDTPEGRLSLLSELLEFTGNENISKNLTYLNILRSCPHPALKPFLADAYRKILGSDNPGDMLLDILGQYIGEASKNENSARGLDHDPSGSSPAQEDAHSEGEHGSSSSDSDSPSSTSSDSPSSTSSDDSDDESDEAEEENTGSEGQKVSSRKIPPLVESLFKLGGRKSIQKGYSPHVTEWVYFLAALDLFEDDDARVQAMTALSEDRLHENMTRFYQATTFLVGLAALPDTNARAQTLKQVQPYADKFLQAGENANGFFAAVSLPMLLSPEDRTADNDALMFSVVTKLNGQMDLLRENLDALPQKERVGYLHLLNGLDVSEEVLMRFLRLYRTLPSLKAYESYATHETIMWLISIHEFRDPKDLTYLSQIVDSQESVEDRNLIKAQMAAVVSYELCKVVAETFQYLPTAHLTAETRDKVKYIFGLYAQSSADEFADVLRELARHSKEENGQAFECLSMAALMNIHSVDQLEAYLNIFAMQKKHADRLKLIDLVHEKAHKAASQGEKTTSNWFYVGTFETVSLLPMSQWNANAVDLALKATKALEGRTWYLTDAMGEHSVQDRKTLLSFLFEGDQTIKTTNWLYTTAIVGTFPKKSWTKKVFQNVMSKVRGLESTQKHDLWEACLQKAKDARLAYVLR